MEAPESAQKRLELRLLQKTIVVWVILAQNIVSFLVERLSVRFVVASESIQMSKVFFLLLKRLLHPM